LPTKIQFQAGSVSTTFHTPLALTSFLAEAKRTFTNFPTAHHNLGSSRTMPSRLGGFTSKSNKCHKDYFTKIKYSNHSQRGISQRKLGFIINHSNFGKKFVGESSQRLRNEYVSWLAPAASKGGRRKCFILIP
jgi:hypothetical protein